MQQADSVPNKKWGMLLVGFSLSRAVTYLTMYISPPTSVLPSRPPSELVSSFCLVAGGLIFMASVRPAPFPLLPWCVKTSNLSNTSLLFAEQRYRDSHRELRSRCHVRVHSDHGPHGFYHGLDNLRPRCQGVGRTATSSSSSLAEMMRMMMGGDGDDKNDDAPRSSNRA